MSVTPSYVSVLPTLHTVATRHTRLRRTRTAIPSHLTSTGRKPCRANPTRTSSALLRVSTPPILSLVRRCSTGSSSTTSMRFTIIPQLPCASIVLTRQSAYSTPMLRWTRIRRCGYPRTLPTSMTRDESYVRPSTVRFQDHGTSSTHI